MFATMPPHVQEAAAKESPFNRLGRAQDIADIVAFLCSDEARWLTGQSLHATGGAA
jgi:3-oxoacyl-[acyl-carrier protein] reductase